MCKHHHRPQSLRDVRTISSVKKLYCVSIIGFYSKNLGLHYSEEEVNLEQELVLLYRDLNLMHQSFVRT